MHLAALFSMRQILSTFLYDHSQLHGVKPLRGIWYCTRERATLLVLRASVLVLVLQQQLLSLPLLLLLEMRPPVLRSPRPAHLFGLLTFSAETEIHTLFYYSVKIYPDLPIFSYSNQLPNGPKDYSCCVEHTSTDSFVTNN